MVYADKLSLRDALAVKDAEGIRLGAEFRRLGYDAPESSLHHPLHAYFELYIEQGPLLEQSGNSIGIVLLHAALQTANV